MKNKDLKSKFLFINSKDLKRLTYTIKREFSNNDFDNFYYQNVEESLDEIFDLYEIPTQYRKIALKVNSLWKNKRIEDYITKIIYMYNFNNNNLILGRTQTTFLEKCFKFKTYKSYVKYKDIISFYNELKNIDLLKKYIIAIADFYRLNTIIKNIEEYSEINRKLSIIFNKDNPKDLTNQMSLYELHYLYNIASDSNKKLINEAINKRLNMPKIKKRLF